MTLNHFLVWTVCFSCIVVLVRVFRTSARGNWGWLVVSSTILAITLMMTYFLPTLAGVIGALLWGVFFLLPLLGSLKVNQYTDQQRYQKARQWATGLRWLHPADGWLEKPKILLALELAQKGNLLKATQLLQEYSQNTYHFKVLMYWIKADWKNCLIWFRESVPQSILLQDSLLMIYYLRALGETGNINELIQQVSQLTPHLQRRGAPIHQNLVKMYVFAFCGQISQVRQFFKGPLSNYSATVQSFWILTAQMSTEKRDFARQHLLALRVCQDLILSNAIEWRLCHPPIDPLLALTPSSQQIFQRLKREVNQELRYQNFMKLRSKKAYATWVLISINLAVFALETYQGGNQNLDTLYKLGGLVPELAFNGQQWRLITANFLHYGWLHLLTNMFGLYFLGRFVENALGITRYLIAYFSSGIGSMFLFTLLSLKLHQQGELLVGASAAIMGLIGVISALFFRDWYQQPSSITRKRLQMILGVIVIQFIFDVTTPQVSFLSHIFGLFLGFFTGGIIHNS